MNIICFDTEWLYNNHKKDEKFSFNCEPMLKALQDRYGIEYIYRRILTREDLIHYMKQFNGKRSKDNFPLIYFSSHGWDGSVYLEGERKRESSIIDLEQLAQLWPDFFKGRIVHFSSCRTMYDLEKVKRFKKDSHAKKVSGYKVSVDAMDSLAFDFGYFNALQLYSIQTISKETSRFQKHYASLIDYLQFCIV